MVTIAIPHDKRLYQWPNEGFLTLVQAMLRFEGDQIRTIECEKEELLSRNDYDAVFLMRCIGTGAKYLKHFEENGILVSLWHDDLHRYCWRIPIANEELVRIFNVADIIFLPYFHQFRRWRSYRQFEHKVVWLPWSVPDWIFELSRHSSYLYLYCKILHIPAFILVARLMKDRICSSKVKEPGEI